MGVGTMPENFAPPEPTERPLCSNCGWLMWVTLVEQHEDPELAKHTFKCHQCDYEEIKVLRLPADDD
jgi:hypothetical protein